MSKLFDLQKLVLKTQGHSAKAIDRAPKPVQRRLARMLGYHYPFAALHPFYQGPRFYDQATVHAGEAWIPAL